MPRIFLLIFIAAQALFCPGCAKRDYQGFIAYLKAEQQLRVNNIDEQTLQSQIKALQENYKINPDYEIEKINNNQEMWVVFLTELRSAR